MIKRVLKKQLSFRYKLIISSIACILIPALLSLTLSNVLTKDAVKEQAMENAQDSLRLAEGHVTNTLKNMLYIANFIQIDTEMNSIFKVRAKSQTDQTESMDYHQFSDTLRIISKIDNISIIGEEVLVTILLPNGIYYANYPKHDYDPHQIFNATWFNQLNQMSGLESMWIGAEPYELGYRKNMYSITLARTLRAGSEIYGYVVVTINQGQISSIFNRVAANQELLLINEANIIISHNQLKRVGEQFTSFSNAPDGSGIVEMDGNRYLVSVKEVSAVANWKLVSLTPYKEAVSNINRIYNVVLMLQLISFFVFLLILIFLLERFTRPLVRLGRLAEIVQRGNLEVRSYIRGDDEIGRLGFSFDQMLDRIKEMIQEVTLKHKQKREAELAMLQAQINPHFMFNVLNSIRMKVLRKKDEESAEMISSLSRFMRMSIGSTNDDITLYDELEIVLDYMKLMNLRQKWKVELELQVPSDTFTEEVPRFVLQPLIENAMIHGFNQRAGKITIRARKQESFLVITVADNGLGIPAEKLDQLRMEIEADEANRSDHPSINALGFGLRNVQERMRIKFGAAFDMRIESDKGRGTSILLRIPRKGGGESNVQSDAG